MNIRHLRIFIEVAKSGSMSAAAAKFFISQPSVSQIIHDLESHYETHFFERISQKLHITKTGLAFLERATDIVERFDAMEDEMRELIHGVPFRIGVSPYIDIPVLIEVLDYLHFKCPSVDFPVITTDDRAIEEKVLKFSVDAGIKAGKSRNNDLNNVPIIKDYLALMVPKGHPLYDKEVLTVADLQGCKFSFHEEGSYQREIMEMLKHDHPLNYHLCWETSNMDVLKKSVLNHGSILLSSALAFREEILSGEVHAYIMDNSRNDLTIYLIYPKKKSNSEPLGMLKDVFSQMDLPQLPDQSYFRKFI